MNRGNIHWHKAKMNKIVWMAKQTFMHSHEVICCNLAMFCLMLNRISFDQYLGETTIKNLLTPSIHYETNK